MGRCSLTTSRTVLHLNAGKAMREQTSVCVLKIKTLNIKKKSNVIQATAKAEACHQSNVNSVKFKEQH